MREIKFRAWSKYAMSMQYRTLAEYQEQGFGLPYPHDSEVIVMQFTGLHDKNGKEIYEGDAYRYGNKNGEIVWNTAVGGFKWRFGGIQYDINESGEVIGNIYENPSLLPTQTNQGE